MASLADLSRSVGGNRSVGHSQFMTEATSELLLLLLMMMMMMIMLLIMTVLSRYY